MKYRSARKLAKVYLIGLWNEVVCKTWFNKRHEKFFHRVTPAAVILQDPQAVKQNEKSPAMSLVIGMFSIVYAATGNFRKWLAKAIGILLFVQKFIYSDVVKIREKHINSQPNRVDDIRLLFCLTVFRCWVVDGFRAMSPSPSCKRTRYVEVFYIPSVLTGAKFRSG